MWLQLARFCFWLTVGDRLASFVSNSKATSNFADKGRKSGELTLPTGRLTKLIVASLIQVDAARVSLKEITSARF
jgi:hypothetical protein